LQVRIANARDEPFAGLTTTALGASGALQYGRRVLVPPHARLITWQPFLVPDASRPESEAEGIQELEYQSLLLDEESTSERLMRDEFGSLRIQDTIWLARPGPVTGIVEPPGSSFKSIDPDVVTAANTVEASRLSHRRRHNFVHFEQGLPPGGEESLDGYDQLVIAADTVLHDADAVAAVRRWLFAGGRLWVMLDQADEGVLGALLGDEFDAQVVDRVGLTSVHIQSGAETTRVDEKPREFDKPVAFVRMLVDATPVFTVNGWPAAYWETYGAGRVLVTTLGPEAWVRRLSESERESEELVWRSDYAAGPALRRLTSTFYGPRPAPLLATAVLDAQAREYIGYSIPSRGLVVGMLGAFAAVLIALGVWLLRIGEAQRMAVFGALAALATSLALMGAGRLHRALPSTSALTQFVECLPGTNDVRLTGAAATYIADSGAVGFAGDRGGWLMPEMVGAGGTTHRLVWSEVDEWQWENLEQPPGLHAATFASAARFDDRVTATATFDANGLSGRLTLPAGKTASDALLVTALGRMGVTGTGEGRFHARAADAFSGEQFLAGDLLSDEQSRRSRTLARLLDESTNTEFPFAPMLLCWTEPWLMGLQFPAGSGVVGSALVALPLTLERPEVGTSIRIPAPFVSYHEVSGPQGESLAGLYDDRSREWQSRYGPTITWLHVKLPKIAQPLQPTQVEMTVRVIGPAGRLEVAALQNGEAVPIETWMDPQGTARFSWTAPELLTLNEDGGLSMQIAMGDPERPELTQNPDTGQVSYFRIESLLLEVEATVLDDERHGP
jgi:hypothetical protein